MSKYLKLDNIDHVRFYEGDALDIAIVYKNGDEILSARLSIDNEEGKFQKKVLLDDMKKAGFKFKEMEEKDD